METGKRHKSRSNALLIAEIVIIIISLLAFTTVGVLAWMYYGNTFKKIVRNGSNTNTSQNTNREFATNVVSQPTGTVIDLVGKASPAVVTVISTSGTDSERDFFADENEGSGTGFFVSDVGLLITNEHVVCDSAAPENLKIVTAENKTFNVKKFTVDSVQDIAIVEVDTKNEKVPYLTFANPSSPLKVGQEVLAIGNPLGVNPGSVTKGIISGLDRNITAQGSCKNRVTQKDYEGVIQTDAAINSGNSGGPLLDMNGNVVGVNSATSTGANNISYSVPFQRVLRLLDRYQANNGKLTFPYVGVEYSMIDPTTARAQEIPAGAYARRVVAGGPAEKAGIQRGDIITKIDDKAIEFSLQATLSQYFEPNQKVKVEIYRPSRTSVLDNNLPLEGRYITLDLTIGQR
jgi:2-alkenal reductase